MESSGEELSVCSEVCTEDDDTQTDTTSKSCLNTEFWNSNKIKRFGSKKLSQSGSRIKDKPTDVAATFQNTRVYSSNRFVKVNKDRNHQDPQSEYKPKTELIQTRKTLKYQNLSQHNSRRSEVQNQGKGPSQGNKDTADLGDFSCNKDTSRRKRVSIDNYVDAIIGYDNKSQEPSLLNRRKLHRVSMDPPVQKRRNSHRSSREFMDPPNQKRTNSQRLLPPVEDPRLQARRNSHQSYNDEYSEHGRVRRPRGGDGNLHNDVNRYGNANPSVETNSSFANSQQSRQQCFPERNVYMIAALAIIGVCCTLIVYLVVSTSPPPVIYRPPPPSKYHHYYQEQRPEDFQRMNNHAGQFPPPHEPQHNQWVHNEPARAGNEEYHQPMNTRPEGARPDPQFENIAPHAHEPPIEGSGRHKEEQQRFAEDINVHYDGIRMNLANTDPKTQALKKRVENVLAAVVERLKTNNGKMSEEKEKKQY